MKYLFIFLPFFAFGQDTIVRGSDTMIIGRSYYDNPSFYKEWARAGKSKDAFIPSTDSALYGVRNDTMFVTGERFYLNGFESKSFYVSDRKPKVVESFKYAGAYYELRENGWYKEILPDTIPRIDYFDYKEVAIKIKGDSVFRWAEEPKWISCEQHLFNGSLEPRPYWDQPVKVKLLTWNGCSLIEVEAEKIVGYRIEGRIQEGSMMAIKVDTKVDFTTHYIVKGWHVKPSHVIKEL